MIKGLLSLPCYASIMNAKQFFSYIIILGLQNLTPSDLKSLESELDVEIFKYICDPVAGEVLYEQFTNMLLWQDLEIPTKSSGSSSMWMSDYADSRLYDRKVEFATLLWDRGIAAATLTCYDCSKEGPCEGKQTPLAFYSVTLGIVLWVIMGEHKENEFYMGDWQVPWKQGKAKSLCKECRDAKSAALLAEKAKLLEMVWTFLLLEERLRRKDQSRLHGTEDDSDDDQLPFIPREIWLLILSHADCSADCSLIRRVCRILEKESR